MDLALEPRNKNVKKKERLRRGLMQSRQRQQRWC